MNPTEYIKSNKKILIQKFASPAVYESKKIPATIFMAGSPGAGKTEFSKNLIKILDKPLVRIDADEIRELFPDYTGSNSHLFQSACSKGVEILYDHILHKKYDAIIDGTLASIGVARKNISRALNHDRLVAIFYLYQDPKIAWEFTKAREEKEGRRITKDVFVDTFFKAKENVDALKEIFGDKIVLFLIEKDFKHDVEKFRINIPSIDNLLKIDYTPQTLKKML
ncbi:MAG: Zeta toxin [Candidatus Moranbacteria bacterium GW2011_GWF2_36_839]|nr:MAG: Zeta toxin [Candidatus Moranbacteria bacterium GW2011_GWF1_36_78]KKQ16059.1 MAG: Zeta toxin [Candidatus Moranbacteria bacterium GW2011_GWF2_36_839]HAT74366.1 zeta toxin family protein [Candidatus Moranbacteria bacterium]HBY11244.1 zeta toxin family protein [Candidatus Moranbacteria bacterium]